VQFPDLISLIEALGVSASSMGGAPPGTNERLLSETKAWAGKFMRSALTKWLVFYATGTPCAVSELRDGVPFPCTNHAIGRCDCCGRPMCMHHARVDAHGDGTCYLCIGLGIRRAQAERLANGEAPGPGPFRAPPPPADVRALREERIKRALAELGLKPGAQWRSIKAAHKKLAAKHHPDRFQGEADKRAAHERCVKVTAALSELERLGYKTEAA
jgi:hypothetical protein